MAPNILIPGILWETLQLFALHWRRHVVLSIGVAVPTVVLGALGFFEPILQAVTRSQEATDGVDLPAGLGLRLLSVLALTLMVTSVYAAVWWRGLFEKEGPDNPATPDWGSVLSLVVLKFVVFAALLLAALIGLTFIAGLAALILTPLFAALGGQAVVPVLLSVGLQLALLAIGMRLGPALPPAAWGEDIAFTQAWAAGAGHMVSLAAIALILGLPALLISLLVGQMLALVLADSGAWAGIAAGLLLSPVNFLLHALLLTALAALFRRFRAEEKL